MNTKLNMGVIEDKSITYSKLADDVAESITATMAGSNPDWNAQEGEAGYIENKTHKIIWYNKPEDVNFNSALLALQNKTPEIIIEDSFIRATYRQVDELEDMVIHGFKFFKKNWNNNNDYEGHISRFNDTFNVGEAEGQFKIDYDDYEHLYITIQWNNEWITINEILTLIDENYYVVSEEKFDINVLDPVYLPDSVIKTTPQMLSGTYKNQALANLGIDPVVWKYICDPLIIKSGQKVPEELIGEYNEDVGDPAYPGGYKLKYPYTGMYRIDVKNYYDEYSSDLHLIINPSSADVYGLVIRDIWTPQNSMTGAVWINSDKKWETDAF